MTWISASTEARFYSWSMLPLNGNSTFYILLQFGINDFIMGVIFQIRFFIRFRSKITCEKQNIDGLCRATCFLTEIIPFINLTNWGHSVLCLAVGWLPLTTLSWMKCMQSIRIKVLSKTYMVNLIKWLLHFLTVLLYPVVVVDLLIIACLYLRQRRSKCFTFLMVWD